MTANLPSAGVRCILLPRILDLPAAAPLAAALLTHRGGPVGLDASGVEWLGAQCAQVIVSGCMTWANEGNAFYILNPSDVFLQAAQVLGLPAAKLGKMETTE